MKGYETMLEERTLNLINADIDGELTAVERQELDQILETSAEARTMRNELLKLSNLLESAPLQTPPPGLSERILSQLKPSKTAARSVVTGFFKSFQPATAGLAFAAGLLLTVGFYEMSPQKVTSGNPASMVGTIVAGQPGGLNLLENNLYFNNDGLSGTVSLVEKSGLYVLNFDLDSEQRKQIEVGLDQTGLVFGGFAETPGISDNVVDSVSITAASMRVSSQGKQNFAIFLREKSGGQSVAADLITIDFSNDESSGIPSASES